MIPLRSGAVASCDSGRRPPTRAAPNVGTGAPPPPVAAARERGVDAGGPTIDASAADDGRAVGAAVAQVRRDGVAVNAVEAAAAAAAGADGPLHSGTGLSAAQERGVDTLGAVVGVPAAAPSAVTPCHADGVNGVAGGDANCMTDAVAADVDARAEDSLSSTNVVAVSGATDDAGDDSTPAAPTTASASGCGVVVVAAAEAEAAPTPAAVDALVAEGTIADAVPDGAVLWARTAASVGGSPSVGPDLLLADDAGETAVVLLNGERAAKDEDARGVAADGSVCKAGAEGGCTLHNGVVVADRVPRAALAPGGSGATAATVTPAPHTTGYGCRSGSDGVESSGTQ